MFVDYEEVEIFGATKKKRELAEKVVTFAKSKLFPRHGRCLLEVELVNNLTTKESVAGEAWDNGEREFFVRVDSALEREDFITTLLHELVHVKQYLKGELKDAPNFRVVWKKTEYDRDTEYHDRPWEIEAYKLEKELTKQFLAI